MVLLDAARAAHIKRLVLVYSDEVYGDIEPPYEADETFPVKPSSPYAASKAAADMLALSVRPHLPAAGGAHPSVQHLRPISVSGEAHTAHDLRMSWRPSLCPFTATAFRSETGSSSTITAAQSLRCLSTAV